MMLLPVDWEGGRASAGWIWEQTNLRSLGSRLPASLYGRPEGREGGIAGIVAVVVGFVVPSEGLVVI